MPARCSTRPTRPPCSAHATEALRRRAPAAPSTVELPTRRGGADVLPAPWATGPAAPASSSTSSSSGPAEPHREAHRATAAGCPCPAWSAPARCGCAPAGEVETVFRSGEWLAVEGEPGVGKLALLRAVQLRRQPVRRFEVLDAAERGSDRGLAADGRATTWPDGTRQRGDQARDTLDRLPAARARRGAAGAPGRPGEHGRLWVAVTLAPAPARRRHWPSCCGSSRAPSRCRRCASTSRTCPRWCRSSSASSGRAASSTCSPEAMRTADAR